MKSPRAIRKPRDLVDERGYTRGIVYSDGEGIWMDIGRITAPEGRRALKWLTRAVEYLESKEKKERKGK